MYTPPNGGRSQFVICLAGHIDHGKSAIVRSLTGATVDRLPEEQRRGITIELGFSHFEVDGCRFALIDVPGHERLVHTMVAGASGVDVALLVVAADDSVMPQTREHLAVLQLLGIQRGVIAISKCDLADQEQLDFVELEIADLVEGTFFADAPRVRVSATRSTGMEELRDRLVQAARSSPARLTANAAFRLSIDRAFSPAGQGAVVTGTVSKGVARVGDTVQLFPAATAVRIRRLQSQGQDVEHVVAGERAAINLVGVKASSIQRGHELTTPNAFEPARRHLVEVEVLSDADVRLKHRQIVRVHLGANQTTAQILLGQSDVVPGQTAFAVLNCATPIITEYGQAFVLRQLSPVTTIGGGRIISPALRPIDRLNRCLVAAAGLASEDPLVRLAAYVEVRREVSLAPSGDSPTGLTQAELDAAIRTLIQRKEMVRTAGPQPTLITSRRFTQLQQRFLACCQRELELRRPASQVPLSVIMSSMLRHATVAVLELLLETMLSTGELIRRGDHIGLLAGPQLTHRQRALLDAVVAEITSAGSAPQTLKELAEKHDYPLKDLERLIQVAADQGWLIRVSPQMAFDREALERLRQSLVTYFQLHPTCTVGEIREEWQMTRKHVVPILEFFDHCQITTRTGDNRSAGPRVLLTVEKASA